MVTPIPRGTPRIGARVLLLDQDDRVLLIHAKDSDEPTEHWWELPGGGVDPGEQLRDAARRELAEETGILVDQLGPHLWIARHVSGTAVAITTAARPSTSHV